MGGFLTSMAILCLVDTFVIVGWYLENESLGPDFSHTNITGELCRLK